MAPVAASSDCQNASSNHCVRHQEIDINSEYLNRQKCDKISVSYTTIETLFMYFKIELDYNKNYG